MENKPDRQVRPAIVLPSDEQIDAMEPEDLIAFVASGSVLTAAVLESLARGWRRLEQLGLTPKVRQAIRGPGSQLLLKYLPKIAAGAVLAQTVIQFGGWSLRLVSSLPPDDQRRITAGEPVAVYEREPGGGFTHRLFQVGDLTLQQLQQVFHPDGYIRTEQQQIAYLTQQPPAYKPGKVVRSGDYIIDPKSGTVRIRHSKQTLILDELLVALKAAGVAV